MSDTVLAVTLLSDACFGATRLTTVDDVDTCQAVDDMGLPYIGGRLLKGLLVEEVAIVLRSLSALNNEKNPWHQAALTAFGQPGDTQGASLFIGNATFPPEIRNGFFEAAKKNPQLIELATRSTTVIRRQTRIDSDTGVADDHSLRSTRLLRRGETLLAPLRYRGGSLEPAPSEVKALLAMATRLIRRGGMQRSRGWGHLHCRVLHDGKEVAWEKPLLAVLQGGK